MRKLIISRKGMLFTIGLTFLGLVILALATLIFHNAQESEALVAKLALLDRVYDLDMSLEQSLRDIFYFKAGISINITDNGVSFQEELPNLNGGAFNSSMKSFENFVESNFSNVNITVDEISTQLPLAIRPYDITYKHVNFGDKQIQVIPEQINFNGYSVFMTINKNITSCSWNPVAGSFNFSVEVRDTEGDSCSNSMLIDPSGESIVNINIGAVSIEVDNNILYIVISEGSGISADVKTTVQLGSTGTAYVEYPSTVIQISFNELGVYKESNVNLR